MPIITVVGEKGHSWTKGMGRGETMRPEPGWEVGGARILELNLHSSLSSAACSLYSLSLFGNLSEPWFPRPSNGEANGLTTKQHVHSTQCALVQAGC